LVKPIIGNLFSITYSAVEHVHHEGGGGDTGEPTPVAQNRLYSHGDSIEAAQLLPAFGESALPGDLEPLYSDDSFAVEPPVTMY